MKTMILFLAAAAGCVGCADTETPNQPGDDPAAKPTIFVSPSGSDAHDGFSASEPLQTIQLALELAQPGDTIGLAPGDYHQDVRSVRSGEEEFPITVVGPPDAIIRGAGTSRIVELNHSYLILDGFTIDGLHGDPDAPSGYRDKLLYIMGQDRDTGVVGLKIRNMTFRNGGGECLRLKYFAQFNEISNCMFDSCGVHDFRFDAGGKNGEAIYIGTAPEQLDENPTPDIDESSGNWIHHNVFDTQGNECVDIKEGSTDNIVENNTCTGQLDPHAGGISSRGCANVIRRNWIFGCIGAGVRLGGDSLTDGINNSVHDNLIHDNEFSGLKIERMPQAMVCGNEIFNVDRPIRGRYGDAFDPEEECP